jgi:hypothetical protein
MSEKQTTDGVSVDADVSKPILIMAKTHQHARDCAKFLGLAPNEFVYYNMPQKIEGFPRGMAIYKYGNWYEHPAADKLIEIAQARMSVWL